MNYICQHCGKPNITQTKGTRFQKPTVQEAWLHGHSIGLSQEESRAFWDYQESKGWKVGNSPMKDWQAAMRTWKRNAGKFDKGNGRFEQPKSPVLKPIEAAEYNPSRLRHQFPITGEKP